MAFYNIVFLMVVFISSTYAAAVLAPVAHAAVVDTEYDPNPQYSYAYDVQDALTGDSKNHRETRNGDVVEGSYSLTDADGTRRTVDYTADSINGFNAVVRKEPLVAVSPVAPLVAKVAAPVVAVNRAAPAYQPLVQARPAHLVTKVAKVSTPIAYTAPVAYSAPVAPIAPIAPVAYSTYPYVARYAATPLAYTSPFQVSAPLVAKLSAPLVTKFAHY